MLLGNARFTITCAGVCSTKRVSQAWHKQPSVLVLTLLQALAKGLKVRVMSYNLLADELVSACAVQLSDMYPNKLRAPGLCNLNWAFRQLACQQLVMAVSCLHFCAIGALGLHNRCASGALRLLNRRLRTCA